MILGIFPHLDSESDFHQCYLPVRTNNVLEDQFLEVEIIHPFLKLHPARDPENLVLEQLGFQDHAESIKNIKIIENKRTKLQK